MQNKFDLALVSFRPYECKSNFKNSSDGFKIMNAHKHLRMKKA